jgi:hypothetical protein
MKMKIVPVLCAFISTLFLITVSGQEINEIKTSKEAKKNENFHLYLLVGGSNMLVKNTFPKIEKKTSSRIFIFDTGNEWVSAEEHIKATEGKPEQEEGTGPSIFFAEAMIGVKKGSDLTIGIINCAEEDSELADWMKGGKYYAKAVEKTRLAMKTGVLNGILWHQANAETKGTDPLKYAENISQIARDLRKDLNSPDFHPIPFVGGKLVTYPYELDKEKDQFKKLNDTLQETFNDTDRSGLVESKGLKDSGDGIRFTPESMGEMGKRYADAMIYLGGKKKTEQKKKPEGKK